LKYICIDDTTKKIIEESDKEPFYKYSVTHKEIYPNGVTKIWVNRG